LVVILALVATVTWAGTIRPESLDPNTVLAQLDETPFGSALLSMVAVQLSTNGPLDEIVVLLNQIRKSLRTDKEEDLAQNQTNQANCDGTISRYQKQLVVFKSQRQDNIKTRDITQAALEIAQKDLTETMNALNLNGRRLNEGQHERDAQHSDYAKFLSEHEQGVKALDGAIQLLQHLQSGSSFVQLKHRFEKVTQELVEVAKSSSKGNLYTPLITALAELAEKANPEMVGKIMTLFNELRATFVADQQASTNVENKQMKQWTSLKADLETEKDQLNEKRADLERQIEGYNKIISDAKKAIASLSKQIKDTKGNLAQTQKSCTEMSAAFIRRTNERQREDDIVRKVIEYFQKRAKSTTDFINDRTRKHTL